MIFPTTRPTYMPTYHLQLPHSLTIHFCTVNPHILLLMHKISTCFPHYIFVFVNVMNGLKLILTNDSGSAILGTSRTIKEATLSTSYQKGLSWRIVFDNLWLGASLICVPHQHWMRFATNYNILNTKKSRRAWLCSTAFACVVLLEVLWKTRIS